LFQGNEWTYVKDCIDTGWVSSVGSYVDRFERDLAEFTGAKRAVAVVNGTAALQIALKLAGVESGDEVLTPALTFVATANAVAYCGAVPHFVDSEFRTLGLDPRKLANYLKDIAELTADGCHNRITGRRIRAVVPMHTLVILWIWIHWLNYVLDGRLRSSRMRRRDSAHITKGGIPERLGISEP
jgi:perosamine synthetase